MESITRTKPVRLPFTGSCHCGATRYIAHLRFPLEAPPAGPTTDASPLPRQRIYRCPCTVCVKMNYFHTRLFSAPDDFVLLAPLDPMEGGLGDYTTNEHVLHFLYCKRCAVRCFVFSGPGEIVEVEEPEILRGKEWARDALTYVGSKDGGADASEEGKNRMIKVWRPSKALWNPLEDSEDSPQCYLSVNAVTLDAGQEGLDLREWTEQKKVIYLDDQDTRWFDRPCFGGTY
jgi:hypothetical protein